MNPAHDAAPSRDSVLNAITVDVEDYFQAEGLRPLIERSNWESQELRVEQNVRRLLDIFDAHNVKSTFFVLGWIAERLPDIVREIQSAGHEIASHGHAHKLIYEQTPDEFREDIRKAKALIEDISGEEVLGYRAPTFSITEKTLWALDVLAEEGLRYDSSIFPVRHDRYGIPRWSRYVETVELRNGMKIVEVPPITARILGLNLPVAGGGYLRLAPCWVASWAIRRMNTQGHPAILYLHPWEIDPGQPRFPVSLSRRFRHYVNLSTTEAKLRRLLASGSFTRLKDLLSL